jgi:hypothetical protein
MAINSFTMNMPKEDAPKKVYQPRPQFSVPSHHDELVGEALTAKSVSLNLTITNLSTRAPNMVAMMHKRADTIKRIMDDPRRPWCVPAVDLNVFCEALQDLHAKLVRLNEGVSAVKAASLREILEAAQVGWKKPAEIPEEILRLREDRRFWSPVTFPEDKK